MKIKKLLKKAWDFSKGNKTIFCLILVNMVELGLIPLTGGWSLAIKAILYSLTGGSIYDHWKSGHFSIKKMVQEK
jgi:hypothetical protein